jgi:hypothetical protein
MRANLLNNRGPCQPIGKAGITHHVGEIVALREKSFFRRALGIVARRTGWGDAAIEAGTVPYNGN